jgi:hypothetical protein
VVSRGDTAAIIHLRERLARLVGALADARGAPPAVLPVLVVPRRHGRAQAAHLGQLLAQSPVGSVITRVGWLAWDPRAVTGLEAGKLWPRTALARSAAQVIRALKEMAPTRAPNPTPGPARGPAGGYPAAVREHR